MLQKYLELLKKGIDALTGLSIKDASLFDYITAVGYEFAIVFLGILGLAACAAAIFGPYLFTTKIKKRLYVKVKEKDNWYYEFDFIPSFCSDFKENYYRCEKAFKDMETKLKTKVAEIEGYTEMFEVLKTMNEKTSGFARFKKICTTQEIKNDLKQDMKKIADIDDQFGISDKRRAAYQEAVDYETKIKYILLAINIATWFIWALFMIPLVLMFF